MRPRILVLAFVLVALLGLAFVSLTGALPSGSVTAAPLPGADEAGPETFLIPLSLPDPASVDVPAGAMPWQAAAIARSLMTQRAAPLMAGLGRLKDEGKIYSYEFDPALQAVKVSAWRDTAEVKQAAALASASAPIPVEQGQACAANSAAAFEGVVAARIQQQIVASMAQQASAAAPAAYPTIELYSAPGGAYEAVPSTAYDYIGGLAMPNVPVSLRVLRGGQVIVTAETTSTSTGRYAFYPAYDSCGTRFAPGYPDLLYQWDLRVGDVVEVTSQGQVASTAVVDLSAWVDPTQDIAGGSTAAGRNVVGLIVLQNLSSGSCLEMMKEETATAGADGSFTLNFGGNFNSSAWARICSRDAAGNGPCRVVPAYHIGLSPLISAYPAQLVLTGQVKPNAPYTARLVRDGAEVSSAAGTATPTGYVRAAFPQYSPQPQVGDVVHLESDGVALQYTVGQLDGVLDAAANQATGHAPVGSTLRVVYGRRETGWSGCSASTTCLAPQVNASGAFTLNLPGDVIGGDYVSLTAYDPAGNWQETRPINAPALFADLSYDYVGGYWGQPIAGVLPIRITDKDGRQKQSYSALVDDWDSAFWAYEPSDSMTAGDVVTAGIAGGSTPPIAMTVQDFTARVDSKTGRITGHSPGGTIVSKIWFSPTAYYTPICDASRRAQGSDCRELKLDPGDYWLDYASYLNLRPGERIEVSFRGADGGYTRVTTSIFQVRIALADTAISGTTEIEGETVTSALIRGGAQVASCTTESQGYYYSCYWPHDGGTADIRPGDTVQVVTSGGETATLVVPALTGQGFDAPASIQGQWLPNVPVSVGYGEQVITAPNGIPQQSQTMPTSAVSRADAAGRYSFSFAGVRRRTTESASTCLPVRPASPCSFYNVYGCYPEGHTVTLSKTANAPGTDAFEPDDTQAQAKAYAGLQPHTFSRQDDVDWVRFEVAAGDVAKQTRHRVSVTNLVTGARLRMQVVEPNGHTVELSWPPTLPLEGAAAFTWTPSMAGTHYLRVARPDGLGSLFCGDVYDLAIRPQGRPAYLPLLLR